MAISFSEANKLNDFGKNYSELAKYSGGQELSNSINHKNLNLNESNDLYKYSDENNQDSFLDKTDNEILDLVNDKDFIEPESFDSNEDITAANDSEKNEMNQDNSGSEGGDNGSPSVEELIKSLNNLRPGSSNGEKNNEGQSEESCGNNGCNKKVVVIKRFIPVPMMNGYNIHYGGQGHVPNFGFGMNQHRGGHEFIDYSNRGKNQHNNNNSNDENNCGNDSHRNENGCNKEKHRHIEPPKREPKYLECDADIVRKIEHMLRRIPNGEDYNSHGSSGCYSSGHFAPLRFHDIEGPLKQLSNAGKTGNTGSMAVAIRSGMGGLQKGPNRVAEFFTVFNDGMRKYAGHMKKQMVKGSGEIRDIYVLRQKMALYARSFYGNEHQLADFIKLLFMHFNCSQAAKSNFAQTLSMMIEYSNSARVRNVSYGYRPLQSSIRRFTDMLNTHYTCQSNRIFDGNGRHIGEVIDSAISGDSGAIYEFVEIIVRSANKNIRLFRNDVLTLIYTSQTYMNLFSTSLYNVFSAITGDPTHLANVIDSTTRGFIRHKRTVRYLLYFYKSYYRLKHVYIGDIIMRFVSSFFVVLCIFWIPFCCCC
ncbi:hypothetical protein AYI70_g8229 [Smittium culicis]|uniref:Uncharacterized protein n=1 Tax=Smittium culicis TaxID=133412 RepID=A0A1R1XH29_9FUNG|nr:hypothetical protein AYI70_g8229 [Smittium culicis]